MKKMIRLNRNNPQELIITIKELDELLEMDQNLEHFFVVEKTLKDINQYQQANTINLTDIRVKRGTPLGEILFERARREVQNDPESLIDSLIFNAVNNKDEDFFDHIHETLKKEETAPSDYMVEQILLARKNSFTNEKVAPFCVEQEAKIKEKSLV